MEKNVTREKLVKCATCPFYNRCPDNVRLSPLCVRNQDKAKSWCYMGEEALNRLGMLHLN